MATINFLFRKPLFPIIIDTVNGLIGTTSLAACGKRLSSFTFPDQRPCVVIDSNADGFAFHPEFMTFSPFTVKSRWSKAAIIDLYNSQKEAGRPPYPSTSLSNKNLEKIVKDIVALLTGPMTADGVIAPEK